MNGWLRFGIEVIAIFIFIKFLFFPILGYALGVQYPIVAVISESMEHNNIDETQYENMPFSGGINTGDAMILHRSDNISVGDVIVFSRKDGGYIIHRVISLNPIHTKGDANKWQIDGVETNISKNQIIGEAWITVPYIGYVKTWFVKLINIV